MVYICFSSDLFIEILLFMIYYFSTETVEESSSTRSLYDNELAKLKEYIQTLNKEIVDLKREKSQTQSPYHTSQVSTWNMSLTFHKIIIYL